MQSFLKKSKVYGVSLVQYYRFKTIKLILDDTCGIRAQQVVGLIYVSWRHGKTVSKSEETPQRWDTVGDNASEWTGSGIVHKTSGTDSNVFNHYAKAPR